MLLQKLVFPPFALLVSLLASMSAIDLTILKVLVGGILAVATFAGAVLPRVLKSYDPSATSKWMPLGNCFSGGLLLGAGLLHFFTEAAATLADVSGQTDCGDAATAALKLSTAWLLGGIFASLFIDRVLLRSAMLSSAAAALHGHSHDSSERSPSTSDAGDEQQRESDGSTGASGTTAFIVAMLLGFHAALEGVSLAYEPSGAALRNGFVPLMVHKFFDGLLLGIQAAKSPAPHSPASAANERRGKFRGGKSEEIVVVSAEEGDNSKPAPQPPPTVTQPFLCVVGGWACITPLVLIALVSMGAGSRGSPAHEHKGSNPRPWGPQLQCLGAGTFVYVALMEVLTSEFRAHHPRAPQAWGPSAKLAVVVLGTVIVRMLESGHRH
jgi:hypothetical protein